MSAREFLSRMKGGTKKWTWEPEIVPSPLPSHPTQRPTIKIIRAPK